MEDIKYAIFHYLHMYHRRRNNKEELKSMIVLNRDKFKRYDSFGYLELLVFLHSLDDIKNFSYCIKFIQKAQLYKDNLKYAENHGYKVLFAHIVADSFEQTQQNPDLYKGLIQEAKDAIEDAIALSDGFAKYYFIAGKLNALCLDFDEAKKLVLKAIYIEDSFQIDYAVRFAPYSAELIKIEAKQGLQDANKSLNELRKKTMLLMHV